MKITLEWLESKHACPELVEWYKCRQETDCNFHCANWLISRKLSYDNAIKYSMYSAKQALRIFERKYSNDDRPRKIFKLVKKHINNKIRNDQLLQSEDFVSVLNNYCTPTYYAVMAAYNAYSAFMSRHFVEYDACDAASCVYPLTEHGNSEDLKCLTEIINYGKELIEAKNG